MGLWARVCVWIGIWCVVCGGGGGVEVCVCVQLAGQRCGVGGWGKLENKIQVYFYFMLGSVAAAGWLQAVAALWGLI